MSDNRKLPRKKPQDLPPEEPSPEPNNQPPPDMMMDAGLLALEYEEQLQRQFKMAHDTPKAEKVIEEPHISPENPVKEKKISILKLTGKKTEKKKVYVESEDMVRLDRHGRTILHRAALDQNVELIRELCTRAKAMDHPGTFINKKDKFGNTALISACVASIEDVKGGRSKCIEALLLASANPNITNDRTRWGPLDWCAFHGDIPSIQKLLKADAFVFMPDAKGMYPIDHCGLQDKQLGDSRKGAAKIIIERMKQIIIEFDNDQDKIEVVQAKYIDNNRYRYMRMPTFRQAALYWAIYFKLKIDEIIEPLLHCENIFPEMPMKSLSMRNCYHACCLVGNLEALKALFDAEILAKRYQKVTGISASQNPDEVPMKPAALTFFSISEIEKQAKLFSKKFISNVKKRQDWLNNFQNQVFKQMTTSQEKHKALPYFEHQDDLGNTPLHLASAHGYTEIVKFLLEKGMSIGVSILIDFTGIDVNIDIQNREGWRCQEIRQFDEIKIAYNEHIQKKLMLKTLEYADLGNLSLLESKPAEEHSQHPLKITASNRNNTSAEEFKRNVTFSNKGVGKLLDKTLFFYKEKRVIPDVVLVFNIPLDKQKKHNDLLTNRINFNITNLKTKLTCYMTCGVSKKLFFLMIKMDEHKLAKICSENGIKVKLLGDYAHHPFNLNRKAEFEPFRSRQRQEITLTALNKIVDLNQLRNINVLHNIYPMHTISGLDKIFNIWVWPKKWYLPEPLASLHEYFGEGKSLNFGAITALRSYFGEKISFYFAWVSFYTCNLLWLAVPGLVVYILQLARPGYDYILLPAWVTYNSLVCTLLVEKWKRKSSEIATRWGTINLENKTMDEKTIRRDYIGDEAIEDITLSLTKVSRHSHRLFYYVISSIILIILGAVVVGSFVLTEMLTSDDPDTTTNEANKYPPIIKTLIGCINGVIVAIANFIYEKAARYFASKENHKFNDSHEKSLIFKIVLFKALNSYLGLFYLTFIKRKDFSDMFYNLVSLLITNQASALATSFLLPFVHYKSQLKLYFNKIAVRGKSQWGLKGKNYTSAVPHGDNQPANQTYPYLRSVLDCSTGTTSDKKWDLMQVELNSLKVEKPDILDYYGSTLVQWGYITMFSPAFALGPLLAIAANIIDIKAKIYTFLTVYQRPVAEKAGGIGYWLYAWEITSIIAIFINALSLFFNLDSTMNFMEDFFGVDDTQDIITDPSKDIDRLWVFVIVVHIILVVKFLVIALVPDKPKWVLKREEKQQHEEDQAMEMQKDAEAVLRVQTLDEDTQKLMMSKIQEKQAKKTVALFKSPQNMKLNDLKLSSKNKKESTLMIHTPQKSNLKPITSPENGNNETKQVNKPPRLGKSSTPKSETPETPLSVANLNLGQAIKSVLLNTFTNVERTLGVMRISDVTKLADTMMVNCFFCNKERSTLHCLTCNTAFCVNCHTEVHNKVNVSKHRVVPFNSGKPSQASKSKVSSPEKNKADANNWRKFETFNFPISKASNFFFTLKIAYQFLYKLYITDNAITNENQLSSIQKALKFNAKSSSDNKALLKNPEEKELEGELDFTQDKTADKFLELDQYNTEEKFFLNRVAFLNFKKRGAQSTFDDFLKKVKVLEEGSLESKLFLMFDLIDQNDDGMIARREVEDIFKCSIMQNLASPNELGETLDGLFQTADQINKRTIFELVVSNQRAKNLFLTFMQVKAT